MNADTFTFLCASHDSPKACSALNYSLHTTDWAIETLLKLKPREDNGAVLANVTKRLYRIYAHAWFEHKQMFQEFEQDEGAVERFEKLANEFDLMECEAYIIKNWYTGVNTWSEQKQIAL